MSVHKADDHVIPAQLICFLFSFLLLLQSLIISGTVTEVLVRMKDTFFIAGTILLSIKLARDGWEMQLSTLIKKDLTNMTYFINRWNKIHQPMVTTWEGKPINGKSNGGLLYLRSSS